MTATIESTTATSTFLSLRTVARVYIATVSLVGFATLALAIPSIGEHRPMLFAVLLCLSLVVSMAKITIPVPGSDSSLTVCHVIDYTTLIVCGPEAAVLVAAWGGWAQCTFFSTGKNPLHRVVFSVATLALTMYCAGAAYEALGGEPGMWTRSQRFEPFIAAATVSFILNSLLIAGAVALSTRQSIPLVWFDSFLASWPSYVIGAGLAFGIAIVLEQRAYWLLPLLAGPLLLIHRNFMTYLERTREAVTDPLTGLPNQRGLASHLERELARARRTDKPFAVIFTDLDRFKSLNDRGGHATGDAALKRVAECLKSAVRSGDVCARLGGDEFVLVLSDCGWDAAQSRRDKLQSAIRSIVVDLGHGVRTSLAISAGVAVCPDDGETSEQLLAAADRRMYEAKFSSAESRRFLA